MNRFYGGSTIQKGSNGKDVREWQTYLNNNGFKLTVDGIFGDKTHEATVNYQQNNGLTADGIVGENTWGQAGYRTASNPPSYTPTATPNVGSAPTAPTFNTKPTDMPTIDTTTWDETEKGSAALGAYNSAKGELDGYEAFVPTEYTKGEDVLNAENALNDHLANKPGEYQSAWKTQLDAIMGQIMNREKFSYNINKDPLYQQYKDQYIQQGKLAMADTMGQAAAMTGGYGNSWAQSVGQQAYQQSLGQLGDIAPELYAMALDKYTREGQDLYNQYGMVMDRDNQDYGRYRDTVGDWQTDRGYLTDRYDSERNFDYGKHVDEQNMERLAKEDEYQAILDKIGITGDDYYRGGDIFRTEQANKNNEAWNDYYAREDQRKDGNSLLQQGFQNDMASWEADYNRAWDEYNAAENNNRYQNEEEWRNSEWDRDEERYQDSLEEYTGGTGNTGNSGNTGGNPVTDPAVDPVVAAAIPDEYKQKATTFKNNDDLADWAYGLAAADAITYEQADELIENNMDRNEKYTEKTDESGNVVERTSSYSQMLESFDGWEMETDGGANLFGIDKDAYVRAPDGKSYSLAELKQILIDEGMDASVAQKKLKGLQQKLGISSNWLFGW